LFPNTLKVLSPADKDTALTEEGGNWASVIRALEKSSEGRAALERINDAMRSVIPSFQDVTVTALGGYLVPKFRFGADGEFDPQQLSDGTLRIYGLLLALYQLPAPALLVIEEPEQTVHPGVLSVLADAMREASENTQIIVTTHSPHLVDQFEPEQIRVATLENGVTHVAPIKAAQIKAVKRRLMSLEEFMLAEGLQPERP
jgi:predicted ATPase